ncbi:abnormal spindle-like microcephaly-associated protein isoform X1 [Saccopteryx bilineata]|uniref:abnormal spindle-like microcephaly-associated protein isoform X1 n=1 Tax=Saccopteryx bilineata TaxID=59482 RepID=UPI00338DF4A4
MATQRGCWDVSYREQRPRAGPPGSPPVLTLSHFCAKPFLCFGDVRLGAARTLPLALLNPNAEPAAVTVPRGSAAGFRVSPRAFELQPKEKIVISVTWTPVKEGRVREIVTFLVNGILKHEVILLGNAEEPQKKKNSLWDTIKKKKVSNSSSCKKRISNVQKVNKTFSVPQKGDRVRSPLQACENLGRNESCSPTENNSLIPKENKMPISPISPTSKECLGETCLPLCVPRSTTYTSLHPPERGELWKLECSSISQDFYEEVITETSFNSENSVNGLIEEDSKLIFTPDCSSTLNITQSQGNFLSSDSFVKNTQAANNELDSLMCVSSDTFLTDNLRPVHLESQTVCEIYQTILSPDTFIKDNYGLNQELESKLMNPILSPSQFVKDNMTHISISRHTCKLSPLSPEHRGASSPKAIFEEPKALEMKPNGCSFTKQNQPKFLAVQDISGNSHNTLLKRRPILSTTVTKLKPTTTRENQTETSKPKARRHLCSVVGKGEKGTDDAEEKDALHSFLPVIDTVESKSKGCKRVVSPSSNSSMAHKRKSEGHREDANVIAVTEHFEVQEIKRIHFSPAELKTTAKKTKKGVKPPVSKNMGNREKLDLKKRTDALAYKTPNSKINKRTKRIVSVAQTNLTFIRPLKTDIPRHPMPFAAKNMFYDERWKEKQQQGFTWWLNFILTPDDFTVKTDVSKVNAATVLLGVESQHKPSVPRAPTKDEASLRAYTARCRLNQLRRAACRLFTSEKMVKAIKKLEVEIEARRLIVRKDRHLWKDVGERQKVLTWLLSYNPLWLRIGLETVYGELITLEDNSDVTGMAVFILNRLLWNPDIAAEYRHPSVPHLYRDGHEEALSKFTLKKLLLLVCFLDYAKVSRLIDHDPCLFCIDSEFKTSKEILLAFSRDFLSGEGDLSRHLSLLGLPVTHVQTPLDEFDFAVTNLAVDLQCGVRLVRTMELLTRNWDLSKKLRIPAISRLQKMHNVDIVLEVLKSRGVPLTDEHGGAILSKDIVDRHREKTLALLWKIALAFQVDIALDLDQLKEEINFLKCTWRKKKATCTPLGLAAPLRRKEEAGPLGSCGRPDGSVPLLLEWARAVCAFYSQRVENFTVSFSDGRVLCYLIHHYHPCYMPLDAIRQRTTQTVECALTGSVILNSSSESDDSRLDVSLKAPDPVGGPAAPHTELLENERQNFQLVRSAVRDLGGIPAMIHHGDMSNTIPDEKVVVTFLSFLCARLLHLRRETHAARLIQTAWRQHRLRAEQRRHQERDKAARIIQSAVINFLRERRREKEAQAAVLIQKQWRRLLQQKKLLMVKKERLEKVQNKSALVIQRHWRRYSTRKRFLELRACTVVLQAWIRMRIAAATYQRCRRAAVTIQRCWRARAVGQRDRWSYERLRSTCCHIQARFRRWQHCQLQRQVQATRILQKAFRSWHSRRRAERECCAAAIQAWYRMHRQLRRYRRIRACVVIVQARVRGMLGRRAYRRKREAILTLQRRWRARLQGARARSLYLRMRAAAVCLQAATRALRTRRLRSRLWAARVCQSCWRMRRDRLRFLSLRGFVIWVQARVRRHQQLKKYKKVKTATLVIQIHFRAYLWAKEVRASYRKTRRAVIVLQSACRGMQARKRFHHTLTSVIKIQSYYRAYISRKQFLSLKHAAIRLQSMVRMRQMRERYLHVRAAALFVQRRHRSLQVAAATRAEYMQVRAFCVQLQAWVRGYLVRKQVRLQRRAAVSLQSYFRMRRARQDYLGLRRAALVIQSHYRAHRAWAVQRQDLQAQRAATCLQAVYRGHRVRQRQRQWSRAAQRIQAAFRGYREKRKLQSVLWAVVRIQRWFRACRTACELRAQFLRTRRAAVSLQAAYRGWRVREMLRREHQAATKIQAAFRTAKAQKQYRSLRRATLLLQQRWRARATGRKQRVECAELQSAVLTVQAAWKGRTARRRMQKRHECASIIQSYYRMYAQRKRWKAVRQAVHLLQVHYRACRLGRTQQLLYWKTQAAAVTLQAAYRGMRARRKLQECHRAAITIQSTFRAYSARKRSTAHRASAVTIQRWYRNVQMANHQRQEYLTLKTAATQIQTVYRGLRMRRHVQQLHAAAALIQATFRMHQSKVRYHKVRAAAVVIQVQYRAYHRGKVQRAQYLAVLKAVSTLQAGLRGARVRQVLRERRAAATRIQSCYRRYREQAYFAKLKKTAEAVQHKFQAVTARNVHVQRYQRLRRAAIQIQAVFRGMRARRHVKTMHAAATLIQRRFRTRLLRRRFLALRTTAVWVQRRYRANVCAKQHLEFLPLQKTATQIQSFRSWLVRKRVQEMHTAATVIQATFRMHREQVRYQALKHTAVLVQQRFRARRASQLQREQQGRQGHTAAAIQAVYQAGRARRLSHGERRAAVMKQSAHRRHMQQVLHRRVQRAAEVTQGKYSTSEGQARQHSGRVEVDSQDSTATERSQQHRVAIIVQKHFKAVTARRRYLHLRAAAGSVQRRYRVLAVAHAHAAMRPQSPCRGASASSGTQRGHPATMLIQATDRMCRTRAALQAETRAAVVQNYDRSCVRATAGRGQVLAVQESVQTLGAAGRGVAVRPDLGNGCGGEMVAVSNRPASCGDGPGTQHAAAWSPVVRCPRGSKAPPVTGAQAAECHSQSVAVGTVPKAPREVATGTLETQTCAALRIQTFLQMAACRRRFGRQRRAAVTLQGLFQAQWARRRFLLLRGVVLVVQSHHCARVWAKHQRQMYLQTKSSVIIIQARTRGFLQKRKFQRIKDSIVTIQAAWRRYRARKYACVVKAACRIQAWYRGRRVQRDYLAVLALRHAVHIIQRCFYCRLERARFLKVRASAVIIQRRWRATLSERTAREHFLTMKISEQSTGVRLLRFTAAARGHLAALRIQRAYRRHLAMREAQKRVRSVICIQRWFRARLQSRRFERVCLHIVDIQQEVQERARRARAVTVLQRAAQRVLLRRRREKLIRGIAKFQALWRGYWWRKKHDSMKMRAIRMSLQALSGEAREQDKLCRRTALALHHLLTYRHLSAILEALRHLEAVTRLSPLCCENMAQSGAISKIFVLIRSCNRSVPCMEIISYAVQVLLNVAKYEKTTPAVYEVDSCVSTLLELLQTYREKPGDKVAYKSGNIFTRTCCLLAVLLKATSRTSDVRNRSKVVNCIYSIYMLTARKHRINTERILHNQNENSSIRIPFIPETPIRTKMVSRLKPDWVLRRDSMEEIINPLQAIQMVMDTLGIPY